MGLEIFCSDSLFGWMGTFRLPGVFHKHRMKVHELLYIVHFEQDCRYMVTRPTKALNTWIEWIVFGEHCFLVQHMIVCIHYLTAIQLAMHYHQKVQFQ